MGVYVKRVTAHLVKCSDGQMANVAVFAYKPVGGLSRLGDDNRRMHWRSGASRADSMAANSKFKTNRIVLGYVDDNKKIRVDVGSSVFINEHNLGSFDDYLIDNKSYFIKIENVTTA